MSDIALARRSKNFQIASFTIPTSTRFGTRIILACCPVFLAVSLALRPSRKTAIVYANGAHEYIRDAPFFHGGSFLLVRRYEKVALVGAGPALFASFSEGPFAW